MIKVMRKFLWLDDVRNPFMSYWRDQYIPDFEKEVDEIIWVKNYTEFVKWITQNEFPTEIFFDHDLGESDEMTGYDCAKWLILYCMDNDLDLPMWGIQSANPVGRDNIHGILNNYKKFRKG
jgi:hypothetical protein